MALLSRSLPTVLARSFPSAPWARILTSLTISGAWCAAGCSLLLDTDSLQSKGGHVAPDASNEIDATTGGNDLDGGGTNPDGNASDGASEAKPCVTVLDCQSKNLASCMVNECAANGFCAAPRPYSGVAVDNVGELEVILTADELGYPSLLVDEGTERADIILGIWQRNGQSTDIALRKFDEKPGASSISTSLTAAAPSMFAAFGSSPGLANIGLAHRIRLLFAAAVPASPTKMGMFQLDLDNNLKMAPQNTQPAIDLQLAGYDTKPEGPVPHLVPAPSALGDPIGMWVQSEKLYVYQNTMATEAFATKRVLGFAPLAGTLGGPFAVLETAALGNGAANEATEIWARGSTSLVGLAGDDRGTRRGVAATSSLEGSLPLNFISWAHEPKAGVELSSVWATCAGTTCGASALTPAATTPAVAASLPQLASAKVAGSNTDRNLIDTFQLTQPVAGNAALARTSLVGAMVKLTTQPNTVMLTAESINPAAFTITTVDGPATAASGDAIGASSVAITSHGTVAVAWIEHPTANKAVLKMRRYTVKSCP